ncbi:DNA polymerase III subunit alpha [Streptomyces scabiei]|uniref:DNA polymerase III subunit alpha n=1 Tax=Streptomyces scabiei TaxID=1930 RepID=UPI0029A2F2B0|nr:DNA polymerase III subunit alpha [Streptomyces scabiei]MDX2576676.1 DNA polymerase III subunit alpha [Streptomyces scabiei]MDX3027642.1 DNA polymerase III subunit alpha [Streptomyces scabiei]MDX3206309.1 DNA polymerase III subunit alpha [Streptomyces scabiei]
MRSCGFTHLRVASGYSARYGASLPHALVQRAAERGMTTLALTDRDTVAGTVRFATASAAVGIRPVFGVDIAVAPLAPPDPTASRLRTPVRGGAHVIEPPLRITLLAQNAAGWARLCRLVSAAHAEADGAAPVVSWPTLRSFADQDLVMLLGPSSEPVRALSGGRPDVAGQLLAPWRELAGERLRLEAVYLGRQGTGAGSLRLAARTVGLADQLGVRTVLTNAVRYADPDQHRLADVLDAARLLRPVDRRHLDGGERWLKDPAAMTMAAERIAQAVGEEPARAVRLLAETEATGQSCTLSPADLGLGRPHFPEPSVVGATGEQGSAMRLLRQRCEAGMVARGLDTDARAVRQLEYELECIGRLGFEGYFLAVAQVVADTRALGIRVAARGSGAGSMVNHSLFVATANPLDHRLLFERFLSERRTSLPDIDLDVESERRLEVYDAIIMRFGRERTAVTGMPETYRARHALRDTGLALGIPPQVVGEIAKSFPHIRARDIRGALAELPELRQLASRAGQFGPLWELAEGLDALPRGYAMHPCGVILSNASLLDRLPVQPTPAGYPMVQADKEDVEDLGLLKLDVLGVRMQSAMAYAVAEIRRTTGRLLDLDNPDHVSLNDQQAFEMIRASDTVGLFQLESPGQQDLVGRLQPRHMQDVVADISLFRPGPVSGGMPALYIAARHGAAPKYPHPDLEPVLNDTYGVVIWHEQIIAILATMTGCDRAAGDVARRALADPDRLPKVEAWFRRTAGDRGYTKDVLDEVWETVSSFGAYGFCRAHAVAFAVPALQSAYLKAHFPAYLYAGLLEHDPGMWPRRVIVADARRHGVAVLPVDVNHSRGQHSVEKTGQGWGVRLAFSTVKGISEAETARLTAGQPYTGLQDLWLRARPSLPLAQRLIRIGALDALSPGLTRRDLLLQATELHRQSRNRTATDGQLPLGGELVTAGPSGLPEMTSRDKLGAELDTLSIDVSQHLMEHHHRLLRELGATDAAHLRGRVPGQKVLVAGVRASTQTPPIPSGKRIIFCTLEDGSGLVDIAFFEDSHEHVAHTVFHSGLLLVRGTVEARGPRRTVVGEMAWDLDEVAAARRDHGPQAALDLLGRTSPAPTPAQTATPQRTLTDGTAGARLHPYADLLPAGTRSADLRRLGHRSQGSAG